MIFIFIDLFFENSNKKYLNLLLINFRIYTNNILINGTMKNLKNNFIIWILLLFLFNTFISFVANENKDFKEINFSELIVKINNKEIESVEIKGNNVKGKLKNGEQFYTNAIIYEKFLEDLKTNNVAFKILPLVNPKTKIFGEIFNYLPVLLLLGFLLYNIKMMKGGGEGNPFKFSKSKAKLLQMKGKLTFEDVAGIDEAKNELKELVDFLKDHEKYTSIGAKIPRGCLLVGSPGTGKTLLARAIAGEAGVPFFFISGSDFVEMFVGVGASRVRDMFADAKRNAPCIVFIDEIDAVGRHRGVGIGGGNDEREQTLNQLLVEMDGFEGNEGIIVIAATNREDVLDKALLRPGRFDRQITVQLPDIKGRKEILEVHAKKVKMAPNINLDNVAKSTPGFSGAELANVINEAALLAARNNKKIITNEEIEEATERVLMGVKNQSKVMKEEEKKITAYHEAGHAICTLYCENSDPIHKVTIIPRGRAGGYVSRLPEYDKSYHTKLEIVENIIIAMGGRVAEELIFGKDKITAGASSDIQAATYYAKNMITRWGMSDQIGTVFYAENLRYENGYGAESCSNEILKDIDFAIKKLIVESKEKCFEILDKHKDQLEIIATALLKYETLTGEEVKKLIKGEEIQVEELSQTEKTSSLISKFINKQENEEK